MWEHGIFKALFWNVQRNSNSMCFLMKCIWKLSISISSCAFRMSWIAILWGRPYTIHYLKKFSACVGENVVYSSVDLGSVKSGHKEVCDYVIVVVKKGQGSSKLVDLPFRDILEVLSHKRPTKMLWAFIWLELYAYFKRIFWFFWNRVSLFGPGCPGIGFIDQAGLEP